MKLGLEIHQRLDTGKLFCDCPSVEGKGEPKRLIRMLHPVYSEMGEVDRAAVEAAEREQTYEYLFYDNCNCLVELDEEPPHPMNPDALKIGLEIASHLKSKPVSEVHTMRKIVIDGSNTSGFQRTAVVSVGGKVESERGDVRISTVAIEEESAGIVSRAGAGKPESGGFQSPVFDESKTVSKTASAVSDPVSSSETRNSISAQRGEKSSNTSTTQKQETGFGRAVYSLDRLGIPLVEIGTEPDIKDPEHLKEIAEKLGLILRATGKVMRGLGTIRQDVNISIEGGARVEIKGAQDLKLLPLFAENEAKRQQNLLEIISELKGRFNGKVSLEGKKIDLSAAFVGTEAKLLKAGLEAGQRVMGVKLERHAGLVGKEINPSRRYGTELSDYAKTAGVKGIIHSDEDMGKYGISQDEIGEVKKLLRMKNDDASVLVVAKDGVGKKALEKVLERARMDCVPKETRKANEDGTSSYMRPLPGKARLYPETDIPPVKITPELLKSVAEAASEGLEEKKGKLSKLLNKEMADRILRSKHLKLFEKLAAEGIEPMLAATVLEDTMVMLRREGIEIGEGQVSELFSAYRKGEFVKAAIPDILRETSKGKTIGQALEEKQLRKITGKELKKIVEENNGDMAKIMAKYRLRVDAKEVSEMVRKK